MPEATISWSAPPTRRGSNIPRSDRQVIAHLLRRAGFGATAKDVDAYPALGFEGAVDRLINYEAIDDRELEATISRIRASNLTAAHPDKPEIGNPGLEVALWLTRMLITKRPLQEKMALFWHGTSPPPSHGTSLPMFVIGGSIKGGVYGNNSNLTDLDTGDLRMQIGFRAVYASVVRNWLGVDPTRISQGNWADIPLTLQPHP